MISKISQMKPDHLYNITEANNQWKSITLVESLTHNLKNENIVSKVHMKDVMLLYDSLGMCKGEELWSIIGLENLTIEYIGKKEDYPEYFL